MTSNPSDTGKSRQQAVTPVSVKLLPIKILRLWFSIIGRVLPGLSARVAYRIWISTRRFSPPLREQQWLKHAKHSVIKCKQIPVAVYEWSDQQNNNRLVILVHGWNGRAAQMGAIAMQLAQAGYRALAIDLPAHGETPGKYTNALMMADVLDEVIRRKGGVHAIVTHSFGLFPVAILLKQGLNVERVVCLSPADNIHYLIRQFADAFMLTDKTLVRLYRRVEKKYGKDLWDRISPDKNVSNLTVPALIIHDEDDKAVAIAHAINLTQCWPGARLIKTSGLGHQRLLRDKEVIEKIVAHIVL